jgi:hypothetical protein
VSQSWLRRDVEDTGAGRNPVAEPQPEDAMALERAAVWAARLCATAMRDEPPRGPFAYRAPDVSARIAGTVSVNAGTEYDRPCCVADPSHARRILIETD